MYTFIYPVVIFTFSLRALDKECFACSKILFLSTNPMLWVLNETILLSTYNAGFGWIIRERLWGKELQIPPYMDLC